MPGHSGLPRLLAGLGSGARPLTLLEHERVHGPLPEPSPSELIEAVRRSGLRGRGGADFPTAQKLEAVASRRRVSAVVVNGSETEPASEKDSLLLARLPHLVLDGALLAARTVGAPEVIVRIPDHASHVEEALRAAIEERGRSRIGMRIAPGAAGYVAGEESAVIHALGGGPPIPVFVPPRPFERGYRGRPTLIQNVETLAQLALIARFGAAWFRELGTEADPGSALVTISGAVRAPGVYELAFGTTMHDLIEAAGGPSDHLQALLVGGYFGTWVDARPALELRLAREDLRSVGCSLGSGVIIALGQAACGLNETARLIDYLARQSAGQCGPCVHGLRAVADAVIDLAAGRAAPQEPLRVQRWVAEIRDRGACHHPNGAVRLVESALAVFGGEIDRHRHGRCGAVPAHLPLGGEPPTTARRTR